MDEEGEPVSDRDHVALVRSCHLFEKQRCDRSVGFLKRVEDDRDVIAVAVRGCDILKIGEHADGYADARQLQSVRSGEQFFQEILEARRPTWHGRSYVDARR